MGHTPQSQVVGCTRDQEATVHRATVTCEGHVRRVGGIVRQVIESSDGGGGAGQRRLGGHLRDVLAIDEHAATVVQRGKERGAAACHPTTGSVTCEGRLAL